MRLRRTLAERTLQAMGTAVAAALLAGLSASGAAASSSLVVGPIRQVLKNGIEDTVLVANQRGNNISFRVTTSTAIGNSHAVYTPGFAPLVIEPSTFVLKPDQTVRVHVLKEGAITSPLVEVLFTFQPVGLKGGTGVNVVGQVGAQFTIHPDKLYTAAPTVPTRSGGVGSNYWWLYLLVLISALTGIGAGGWRRSQRKERERQTKAWTSTYARR